MRQFRRGNVKRGAMKRYISLFLAALIAFAGASLSSPAFAAEGEADEEGFSAYSVARLKIFQGTAWIRSPDSGEWEEVTTNTPVTERSRVNIPAGSEAELQFHGGQFVLLTEGTEVDVSKFDETNTVFRLRSGEVRFDLPSDDFSPVRMAIPSGSKVDFNVPGRYWLNVRENGQTRLVVRSGEGSVSHEKGAFGVKAGEEAVIGADVHIAAYEGVPEEEAAPPPPLSEEERQAEVPPAAAYELRNYGDWVHSADYGWVWQPRTAAGWSPYYYGRWAWVSPYGWTWVSYEPWGWYPYHFGWWASDPFLGWVWCPFRSFVSVSFAFGHSHFFHHHGNAFFFPATVRFVRDGRSVRWVPLRPGERFVRSGFTRTDARLARFERPLQRGTVFTRADRGGKREWREWTSVRRDRQTVQVRERAARPSGEAVRRPGPSREERPAVRTPAERIRPERQERVQPRRRSQDIQERAPQRNLRSGESRPVFRGESPSRQRTESGITMRPQRSVPSLPERQVTTTPPPRREAPRAQVPQRREGSVFVGERTRPEPPAGRFAPNRGFVRPDRGGSAGMPEVRRESSRPAVRNSGGGDNFIRGGGFNRGVDSNRGGSFNRGVDSNLGGSFNRGGSGGRSGFGGGGGFRGSGGGGRR
jgi:hypothetical protein